MTGPAIGGNVDDPVEPAQIGTAAHSLIEQTAPRIEPQRQGGEPLPSAPVPPQLAAWLGQTVPPERVDFGPHGSGLSVDFLRTELDELAARRAADGEHVDVDRAPAVDPVEYMRRGLADGYAPGSLAERIERAQLRIDVTPAVDELPLPDAIDPDGRARWHGPQLGRNGPGYFVARETDGRVYADPGHPLFGPYPRDVALSFALAALAACGPAPTDTRGDRA